MNPARASLILLLILGAILFLTGIHWGLPSRAADRYLFGSHPIWSGNQIEALAPSTNDPNRGADVDSNPILNRLHPVVLNETDTQRAQIVQRYRLFTYQPDEMITLMSLAKMHPGQFDFDPRLYQYGGLWIYPVGAFVKLSIRDLKTDRAYYLDHPNQFARMYVVARFYSALWGLLGIYCVFWITRRLTGKLSSATFAALLFMLMPVVLTTAHEAKPHLAGAVLMLLAVVFATRFVETGATRWWILAAIACGAATGMVISAAVGCLIIPVAAILRRMKGSHRLRVLLVSALIAFATYALTNPYVIFNFFAHRQRLQSNLGNSAAMYHTSLSLQSLANAARWLAAGSGPVIALVGAIGCALLLILAVRKQTGAEGEREGGRRDTAAWLLLLPGIVILIQFFLLADSKPAEYARFALFPDIALAIGAVVAIDRFVRDRLRGIVFGILLLLIAPVSFSYVRAFSNDASSPTSRLTAADDLTNLAGNIGLYAEPAPYSCPPVNLFDRKLILLPQRSPDASAANVAFTVQPVDLPRPTGDYLPHRNFSLATPVTWADKVFEIKPVRGFVATADAEWQTPTARSE